MRKNLFFLVYFFLWTITLFAKEPEKQKKIDKDSEYEIEDDTISGRKSGLDAILSETQFSNDELIKTRTNWHDEIKKTVHYLDIDKNKNKKE